MRQTLRLRTECGGARAPSHRDGRAMGGACVLTLLALAAAWHSVAGTAPPMGWNSWDSYGSSLNETTFKANAMAMHKLLQPYGWNYVVIDAGIGASHSSSTSS